jgi:hypothetical protein
MAARLNPSHDQRTRDKIKTSQLINRLMTHVNGDCDLSATQVRAAEILLKKTLPDLGSVELTGKDGQPIPVSLEVIFGRIPEKS